MSTSSPDPKSTKSGAPRRTIHAYASQCITSAQLRCCAHCRRHKIRCSGQVPCATCSRRGLQCVAGDRQRYRKEYVRDLERRLAVTEQQSTSTSDGSPSLDPSAHLLETAATTTSLAQPAYEASLRISNGGPPTNETVDETTQVNPLAIGKPMYVADARGRSVYLGTSSNWSFGRRVSLLVHQNTSSTVAGAPEQLMFPGKVYDLGWTGERHGVPIHDASLPQADHAMFLINAVKFRVGQLFHLYDETSFMDNFSEFHKNADSSRLLNSMWYRHHLLVLAFGKAVLAQTASERPPGYELFLTAMATIPELSFWYPMHSDPLEELEILCCCALYLHSIDCRGAAYRKVSYLAPVSEAYVNSRAMFSHCGLTLHQIGDALRLALDQGLHTDMPYASSYVQQRARKIWWTIHLLDRQMSSLQGLPLATRDEDITAPLPSYDGSPEKVAALKVHIKLAKAMAMIVSNIYGREGRMQFYFLAHMRTALNVIAEVTDELKGAHLSISLNGNGNGISRVSAYLHLLQHECIIMATRPILFNLLESRIASEQLSPPPHCIMTLMHVCRDSALQILRILEALKTQGLLESFLPFDLDALYTSAIIIIMAANVREQLLETTQPWISKAYTLLDDIASRGNRVAGHLKSELEQLEMQMRHLPQHDIHSTEASLASGRGDDGVNSPSAPGLAEVTPPMGIANNLSMWDNNLDGECMATLADSVDLTALDWWFDSRDSTIWLP